MPTAQAAPFIDRVILGDNLPLLERMPDACCDLITIDPPFGTGKIMTSTRGRGHRFDDRLRGGRDGFLRYLRPRLTHMRRVLAGHGTLYVHLDQRTVHAVKLMLDDIFGERQFLNEIIWSYRTGGRAGPRFARKHDTILSYARRFGTHTFHPIRRGRYRTEGLRRDARGRPFKSTRNGPVYFDPRGPRMTDVWDLPFLSTVSVERTGFPTQKPEALLARIIQASSSPEDLVADFFCGSGTALVAARRAGRRFLGCDISREAVELTRRRLEDCPRG